MYLQTEGSGGHFLFPKKKKPLRASPFCLVVAVLHIVFCISAGIFRTGIPGIGIPGTGILRIAVLRIAVLRIGILGTAVVFTLVVCIICVIRHNDALLNLLISFTFLLWLKQNKLFFHIFLFSATCSRKRSGSPEESAAQEAAQAKSRTESRPQW